MKTEEFIDWVRYGTTAIVISTSYFTTKELDQLAEKFIKIGYKVKRHRFLSTRDSDSTYIEALDIYKEDQVESTQSEPNNIEFSDLKEPGEFPNLKSVDSYTYCGVAANNDKRLIEQGNSSVSWNELTGTLTICKGGYCIVKSIEGWWKVAAEKVTFPVKE